MGYALVHGNAAGNAHIGLEGAPERVEFEESVGGLKQGQKKSGIQPPGKAEGECSIRAGTEKRNERRRNVLCGGETF
jgi:hypothetical protein